MKEKKPFLNFNLNFKFAAIVGFILLVSVIFGAVVTFKADLILKKRVADRLEQQKPAEIKITAITAAGCPECFNVKLFIDSIKKMNVRLIAEDSFEYDSEQSKALIGEYGITQVPTLIVTGDLEKNEEMKKFWTQFGGISGNAFVLKKVPAPYLELETGEVRGKVKITMLSDKNCKECYQVTNHLRILAGYGVPTADQQVLDIAASEGKKIQKEYAVLLVPTIIITGDVAAYQSIARVWPQVGTVEDDGAYVFREGVKQMGGYKDLKTGQVIKPAPKQTQQPAQ
ncbi:hypothetical protein C4569_02050 [Candidatus Parcubacteria bacterium]|nr:MAG: hypothetical protein C4569_02050 [Candidatus Parcubacteria bacterium]